VFPINSIVLFSHDQDKKEALISPSYSMSWMDIQSRSRYYTLSRKTMS